MQIINTRVYGSEESIYKSGYPMRLGNPERKLPFKEVDEKDIKRAIKLGKVKTGTGHDNYLKGIIVQFDLKYPEYFSPQLQRYHWIDIVSSQSKMHKIMSRELTQDDFAGEINPKQLLMLNAKIILKDFDYVISNLPMGYMKWMGISTNYLQLKTIYHQRKNHKLKEWRYFCKWIEKLPMFKQIVLGIDE